MLPQAPTLHLHASSTSTTSLSIRRKSDVNVAGTLAPPYHLRLPPPPHRRRIFTVLSSHSPETSSEPSVSSDFTSTVGSPPVTLSSSRLALSPRHVTVLNVAACAVAISATWLFCAAIPTLLAFKRAAESLEKLLDVTREELPGTMAAVRLSGMEISDLTMELSDLGQGISQGVRSSTRAVRVAEEKLRSLANMTPAGGNQHQNQNQNRHS